MTRSERERFRRRIVCIDLWMIFHFTVRGEFCWFTFTVDCVTEAEDDELQINSSQRGSAAGLPQTAWSNLPPASFLCHRNNGQQVISRQQQLLCHQTRNSQMSVLSLLVLSIRAGLQQSVENFISSEVCGD